MKLTSQHITIIIVGVMLLLIIIVYNLTRSRRSKFQYCYDKCFEQFQKYSPGEGMKYCIDKCK